MDVNASSLNMDNWDNNESFSVIVNEDDVLGALPIQESDTQGEETIAFTETHDICMTKDSDDLKGEHVTPADQCFTLDEALVDTDPESGMHLTGINEDNIFSASDNIQTNIADNLTSEPETSLAEVSNDTNIGDGIDILAEASLGLLSENIFNKESVNQIKDIVASTIANFVPSSNNYTNTGVLSSTNEHGYTSIDISAHTGESENPLFENTIDNYTTRTEMVTPTSEKADGITEIEPQTSEPVVQSYENTTEIHPMTDELVIPVTLAEVNCMLNDNNLVDHSLPEDNCSKNPVKNSEPVGSPTPLEESKVTEDDFRVVCDENIEIVESVEICMESSSADVSFESPNATTHPEVVEHSPVYFKSDEDQIEETGSCKQTVTFHAVESNLVPDSDRPTTNKLVQSDPSTIDLQSSLDAISVSISNPMELIPTRRFSAHTDAIDSVSIIETTKGDQTLLETKPISISVAQPQPPEPVKIAISRPIADTSKKLIVLLPSHAIGRSVENKQGDSGRNVQRIRPGIKVPTRNLTSQIVSADEIAKELYAQGLKKTPVRDLPQGGDLFYSRHLTKRLANRIAPSVASTSFIENISKPIKQQSDLHDAGGISDSADLLAILEADIDEWSIDRPPPQLIEAVTSPITARNSPPNLDPPIDSKMELSLAVERKLDPLLERELALKQLNSLDSHGRYKKDSPTKTRRKSKIQVKVDFDEVLLEEDGIPVGQPLVEDVKKKPRAKRTGKPLKRLSTSNNDSKGAHTKKHESHSNGQKVAGESNKTDKGGGKKPKIVLEVSGESSQKIAIKSPELTNGKFNNEGEKTTGSNKDKEYKAVSSSKKKQLASNNNDDVKTEITLEKIMNPPDNPPEKKKYKKRKAEETDEFVGPISRNMPPPPRTYSSRIKRSPMFPDFIVDHLPSTSKIKAVSIIASMGKSKIIPIVPTDSSSNKKESKQTTKTKVVNSPDKVPPPKRGRPPNTHSKVVKTSETKKARVSEPVDGIKMEKKAKKRNASEVERLLMDEGAINMLYSVEQEEENRRAGTTAGVSSKKKLYSTRRIHKDLIMKTRLVKNAVLRLTNSPDASQINVRGKRHSGPPRLKKPQSVIERKVSHDSSDSYRSPPPLTPFGASSPTQVFTYPPRLHLPAEASRIIRRHSSSSNFSSRSTSPNPSRRLSIEAASPQPNTAENIKTAESAESSSKKHARKHGVPIYVKKEETTHTYKGKKKKYSYNSSPVRPTDIIQKTQECLEPKETQKGSTAVSKKNMPIIKTKLKAQLSKNFLKVTKGKAPTPPATKGKRTLSTDKEDHIPDLTSCLAEAATSFISDDDSRTSPSRMFDSRRASNVTSYSNLIKNLETDSQKRQDGEDSGKERSSVRQSVGSFHYKELSVRRYDTMVQVILTSSATKMKNALSLQVLRELRDVLNQLRKDDTCRAVLVTSTGSSFCQGLDFQSLINDKPDKRKIVAQELALAVTQFMTSLAHFNKLIIAGVHGDAVGLGVTMLPFFDMVFASDKATFYTPYARLGQIPEGAAVITLPHMLGNAVTSELLFGCRKLTASEALHYGLVTRILWPDRFQEELLPIIRSLANQSAQSMEATKALLRHSLRSKLDSALESESHLLVQHWTSSECQNNFKRYLGDEDVGPQKQKVDP